MTKNPFDLTLEVVLQNGSMLKTFDDWTSFIDILSTSQLCILRQVIENTIESREIKT